MACFSSARVLAGLSCPTALAAVAFSIRMPAAQSGLGKLGGCAVGAWVEGGGGGGGVQLRPRGCRGTVVQTSSSAVHFPLLEMIPGHGGQTPLAGLALLLSVCVPGQTCLLWSRILGQPQTSMTSFLCMIPSSTLSSPTEDRLRSLTLGPHLGGSELVETHTLPTNGRVHNPGHRDI